MNRVVFCRCGRALAPQEVAGLHRVRNDVDPDNPGILDPRRQPATPLYAECVEFWAGNGDES